MSKIIILKGLPASGKSTWAKEQVEKSNGNIKRVNKDDLRSMIDVGHWSKKNEKFILSMRNMMIAGAVNHGHDIIVDDTNLDPKHEQEIRQIAGTNASVDVKFFDTPLNECLLRDSKRDKPVGEKVIRDMYERYLNKPTQKIRLHDLRLPKTIIVDIDGTLAHMNSRGPHELNRVMEDDCDRIVRDLVTDMYNLDYRIIIVSGRKSTCRTETRAWLDRYSVPYHELFMRQADDNRDDVITKREIYYQYIDGKYDVRFVLDDRNKVVNMWRIEGFKCLQVQDGAF